MAGCGQAAAGFRNMLARSLGSHIRQCLGKRRLLCPWDPELSGWGLACGGGFLGFSTTAERCFQPSRATPRPLSDPGVNHCNFLRFPSYLQVG